jgi:hypothetical protein
MEEVLMEKAQHARKARLTASQIHDVVGDIDPAKAAAILASGATLEELVEAAALASGEREIMGERPRPMTGNVAVVYDILRLEQEAAEEPD